MAVNPYSLKALEEEKLQELHDCNRMLEEQKALKKEAKAMPKAKGRAKGKAKAAPKAKAPKAPCLYMVQRLFRDVGLNHNL